MDDSTKRPPLKRIRRAGLASLLVLLSLVDSSRLSSQGSQTIGGYELVSQQVQKNSVTLFTYRATLTNTGGALAGATATARSMSSSVKIVDGTLTFGPVGAGGSVVSSDTFSFTRNTNNNKFDWSGITWTITAMPNHAPVANAGPDLTRSIGQTAQLDGSASTDADGNPLTYQWSFVSRPLGSLATLSSPTAVKPSFIVDQPGSYVVRLVVTDGFVDSTADTVTLTTLNSAPVANAGPDQTAFLGQPVTLNGSGSSDVDGNTLTFAWSFASRPAGSVAVLTNPTSVMPRFVVDIPGTYVVRLIVNDGFVNSAPDTVSITTQNSPPVANAGPDQTVFVSNTVTLDGSGSTDVDGNPLTYSWALINVPAGSAAVLNNSTAVRPTFVADKPGVYVAQLVVNDGTVSGAPDTVTIATQNSSPVANAGPDQTVLAGRLVQLDGTASLDVDGDPLTFRWSFASVPAGSTAALFGATTAAPSFTVDKAGIFVVQLIVNDGGLDSSPDTVTVTTTNSAPTANAGPDQIGVSIGTSATLDGSSSIDPDGQPLIYSWSLLSRPAGSNATVSGPASALATLPLDVAGDYVAQLIVNDGFVDSAPDTVLIRANSPPNADAGPDQQVTAGDTVHLDGNGSNDPDGNPIGYLWALVSTPPGSAAVLQGATTVAPTFVADVVGPYAVELTVTDSFNASSTDSVLVTASSVTTVAPSITVQPADLTVVAGDVATFVAAAIGIPAPTVQWQVSADGGATFTDIAAATSTTLSFVATPGDNGKQYRAVFTNIVSAVATTAATLTVPTAAELVTVTDTVLVVAGASAPTVTLNPADQSLTEGQTATFLAAATGIPAPTVQWQVKANGGATFTNLAGATSTTLSFVATPGDNGKQYRAVFTNIVAALPTTAATLIVPTDAELVTVTDTVLVVAAASAPTVTLNPADQSLTDGQTATFLAAATGIPAPTVQWQVKANGGATFTNLAGATSTTLSFVATPGDNGKQYRAVFTNIVAALPTTAATLTVPTDAELVTVTDTVLVVAAASAPTVTLNPADQSLTEGQTANFLAAATGIPVPTVQWQVSANGGATFTDIAGATSTTLSFIATPGDNGKQYRAVFTNIAAAVATTAATLTVPTAAEQVTVTDTIEIVAVPIVTVTAIDPDASEEGPDQGVVRFTRIGDPALPLIVNYAIAGTATNGVDYATLSGAIAFAPGQGFVDLAITPLDDSEAEAPETLVLALIDGPDYDLSGPATATVTIADNDRVAAFNVANAAPVSSTAVTVTFDAAPNAAEATAAGNYTIPGLIVSGTPSLAGNMVTLTTSTQSPVVYTVSVAGVTRASDGEPLTTSTADFAGREAFNVASAASLGPTAVTVAFDATPNPAKATTPGNYTIPGLIVTGVSVLPGNTVALTTSVQAAATVYTVNVTGVTRANDGEPLTTFTANFVGHGMNAVTVQALDANASEVGPDSGTVRFLREGDITLGLVVGITVGGTAANGGDYQPTLGNTVIFLPGESFTEVTITPVDDSLLEGSETVVLSLIPDVNYALGATTTATVAIADSALAVTNTNDSGFGSLRQAILNANAHANVTDTVSFNIPGGGVHTITPIAPLPAITDSAIIDGTTQPGYAAMQPVIEIDGSLAGANANGLVVNATNVTIRGLVINRFGTSGSGNIGGAAIVLEGGGSHVVQGNFIGTDPTGSIALPNRTDGIVIDTSSTNLIGGTAAGQANTIAFNGGAGISVRSGSGNAIQANAIFANTGLGIDLGGDGVTPNDAQDVDAGPNNLQNFPIVTSSLSDSGATSVQGTLNSTPLTAFSIQFFANTSCSPSGYGQGASFLGSSLFSTDATGNLSFDTSLPIPVATGQFITTTATRADGSTSEFSACAEVNPGITLTPDTLNLLTREAGTLSVTLTHPAGVGGVAVTLGTSDASVAAVPPSVLVQAGATTATFDVTTGTNAGTATVTASRSGFTSGTSQVAVSLRAMALSSPSPLVAVGHNFAAAIDLSQPAPQGGVTIALVSSDGSHVSVTPSSVTIAEGDQSATFTINGIANGPATITASADGFASATLTITATTSSIISLGSSVVVAPGLDVGLPLSLGKPAPAGGVTVLLSSSNPSVATVTPSVFIAEGLQVPAANPLVHGLTIGSAQIAASAVDFAPDTANVTVTISISLSPNSLNVIQGQTSNATLTLSSPAPVGGLTFNTSVDNTSFATVPATVHVDPGSTSVQVPVTGVAIGDTTLHASAPGITQATIAISVKPAPGISVGDATIGKDLQVSLSGTLGAPAPAGNLQVTITSLDPSQALLAMNATAAGAASIVATVNAGSSTIPAFYVQALTASGAATIQTTAPGYTTDTSTITFQPSGFYLATGNFTTTAFSANTAVSVSSARLDPITLNVAQAQAVRGGLSPVSVDVTSSNGTVGTIENSPAVFVGGDVTKNVEFNPATGGTTTISLATPGGFTAVSNLQQITATVESVITLGNATIGRDLQVAMSGTLGTAPAGNLLVTITSLDPGKVLLTTNPTAAGSASITTTVGAGSSTIPTFYVQALVASGTADIETAAPGYTTDTSTITFQPSGFYLVSSNFTTTTFAANTPVFVGAARLDPFTLNVVQAQAVRGGLSTPISVAVASSDANVGAIENTPAIFTGGEVSKSVEFNPAAPGTTTIDVATPAGFSTAGNQQQITATVESVINVGDAVVGKDLQVAMSGTLGTAPAGNLQVTVTSLAPSQVALATTPTGTGTASITLTVGAGSSTVPAFYVQALAGSGNALLQVTAPGYTTDTITVTLQPSGFYLTTGDFSTTTFEGTRPVFVSAARLDPSTMNVAQAQALRGGLLLTVSVAVTSSDPTVGAIVESPTTLAGGDTTNSVTFDPLTTGTTTISVVTPAGFSTPATAQHITATVSAPDISIGSVTVGRDLQTTVAISLAAAPPSPVTVIVTSNDAGIATITTNGTVAGGTTLTFPNVTSTSVGTITVQGRALGSTTITVRAPGYNDGTGSVIVQPSGFYLASSDFTTTAFAANTPVSVSAARLDPITLNVVQAQAVRGGLSPVSLDVTSSNSAVGTVENSPAVFAGGDTTKSVAFNPATAGTTTLSLPPPAPAGFFTPSNAQQITATVESDINIGDATVGQDLQVSMGGGLGTAPAGNLQVTITSLDPAKVLLSTNPAVGGTASITMMVGAGSSTIPTFYVQALAGSGTASIEATAPGYTTDTSTITLQPSGFYFQTASFTTTSFSTNTTVVVGLARLNPLTLNVVQSQALRGGLLAPVNVSVSNSNPTVGAIVGSPVSFTAGDVTKSLEFDPVNAGTTTIGVATPAGFTTASNAQQVTATVTAPAISISNATVGKDLQLTLGGTLGAPAPAGNVQVTITSLDPSKVLLATNATAAGAGSIALMVGAGSSGIPTFYVQALADVGPAQIEVTATGYTSGTSTITLQPSGFYLQTSSFTTTSFSTNTTVSVAVARLDPLTLNVVQGQALRGGLLTPANVAVSSANPTVGTIVGSPVSFGGGDVTKSIAFDPLNAGTATISVTPPAGFTTPSNSQQITATVTAPSISIGNVTVGKDLQTTAGITLGATPPGPVDVTVTSNNGSIATIANNGTIEGGTTLTFTNVMTSSAGTIFVQGRALGSTTITVHATGYTDGTGTVTVDPSGFYLQTGNIATTTFSTNTNVGVGSARLNPLTLNVVQGQAVRGGLSPVIVAVSSSNPTVGMIVGSPVTFNASDTTKSVTFDPLAAGATTISLTPPAGFTTPNSNQQITATVTAPNISIGNVTVGKDLQTTLGISLAVAPPGPVDVTVTSNNASLATITTNGTVEGGTTLTFTNVTTSSVGTIVVQGRALGSTTITVHATGYNDGTSTVTVDPSGFYLQTGNITTTTFSANTSVAVGAARLNPLTLNVVQNQAVRAGLLAPVNVAINNSNPAVGTIIGSPVSFNAGDTAKSVTFDPLTAGATTISLTPPAGFTTPSNLQQITATVTAPNISIGNVTVGKDLQTTLGISLAVAPPGPVDVTVTSNNASLATITTNGTLEGGTTLTFTNVTTTSVGTIFVQGRTLGTTTITVHATGYNDGTSTVTVHPSGFYLQTGTITTTTSSANTTVVVGAARLDAIFLNVVQAQALRGGFSPAVSVAVTSSNPAVGTIVGSPASFNGGDTTKSLAFDPATAGTTTISVTPPAGFSMPSNNQQIVATVNP